MIKVNSKCPWITLKNIRNIKAVWGDGGTKYIFICYLINNYNHCMGDVDVVEQRFSYYNPGLSYCQKLIPMLLQILGIVTSNPYIIHKQHFKKKAMSYKVFTMGVIKALMENSHKSFEHPSANDIIEEAKSTMTKRATKTNLPYMYLPHPKTGSPKRTCVLRHSDLFNFHLAGCPQINTEPRQHHVPINSQYIHP